MSPMHFLFWERVFKLTQFPRIPCERCRGQGHLFLRVKVKQQLLDLKVKVKVRGHRVRPMRDGAPRHESVRVPQPDGQTDRQTDEVTGVMLQG